MFRKFSILIGLALVAFASPFQAAGGQRIHWWVWVIIVVVILLLVWWWLSRRSEEVTPTATAETPTPASEAATPGLDDLTRIEGIEPNLSGLFKDAGITMIDPSTWPEQASLAAAGEWDALQALQDELKGGRRD